VLRDIAVQCDRAECRDDTLSLGLIFDDDGNAVERPGKRPRARIELVEPIRFGKGVLVDGHDRIERRPLAVKHLDPFEVALDKLPAGKHPPAKRLMDIGDRRFFEFECFVSHAAWPSDDAVP